MVNRKVVAVGKPKVGSRARWYSSVWTSITTLFNRQADNLFSSLEFMTVSFIRSNVEGCANYELDKSDLAVGRVTTRLGHFGGQLFILGYGATGSRWLMSLPGEWLFPSGDQSSDSSWSSYAKPLVGIGISVGGGLAYGYWTGDTSMWSSAVSTIGRFGTAYAFSEGVGRCVDWAYGAGKNVPPQNLHPSYSVARIAAADCSFFAGSTYLAPASWKIATWSVSSVWTLLSPETALAIRQEKPYGWDHFLPKPRNLCAPYMTESGESAARRLGINNWPFTNMSKCQSFEEIAKHVRIVMRREHQDRSGKLNDLDSYKFARKVLYCLLNTGMFPHRPQECR